MPDAGKMMESQSHDLKSSTRALLGGLLPLFMLAHGSHHLLTALPIPLSPMIRSEFSLDYTYAGWVISAFNLSYGIGQLPAGWLADRIGPRSMITLGICGVAVAGFFVGLSERFWVMILFLAFMGFLGGGYHPAAPPMISAIVEPRHRGRALGLHMIGGGASFFLAPIIATAIAVYWGWRGAFIGLAVPTMAFGVFFHLLLKRRGGGGPMDNSPLKRSGEPTPPQRLFRPLIVFIFLSTFSAAVLFSVVSFIPLFLVDEVGYSKEAAGAFFAVIYSAGLWVSPIGGYFSDRFGAIPVILFVLLLTGPVIFLLNFVSSWLGIGILLLSLGIIIYVRMPVSEVYILSRTPKGRRSAVLGIYFFSSMEGGGVLTPVLGYVIEHLGFFAAYTITASIIILTTLICGFLLRNELKPGT
jgi:MFS transporter, NNP family, nitrate/nitrite transporter